MNKPNVSDDIVITKWAGMNATVEIICDKREELLSDYTNDFLNKGLELEQYLNIQEELSYFEQENCHGIVEAGFGGIYGALFQLGYQSNLGFEVDLRKIPLRTETVEICEFFHLNPYLIYSSGCTVMAVAHGDEAVKELQRKHIPAVVVGHLTKEKGRIVRLFEEEKYLTPARRDEVFNVLDREKYQQKFPKKIPKFLECVE